MIHDKLICKILINQLFNTIYAYEDNVEYRFVMGEAELQVFATVIIESKPNTNIKLEKILFHYLKKIILVKLKISVTML